MSLFEDGQEPQSPVSTLESPREESKSQKLTAVSKEILGLNDNDPHREQVLLELMDLIEGAREQSGRFCATIGEGRERAIVLRQPVEKLLREPAMIFRYTNEGKGKREALSVGTIQTSRVEYLVVNREGFIKIAMTTDQTLDVDPNGGYFTRTGDHMTPEHIKDWAERTSGSVKWFTDQAKIRMSRVLQSGSYPDQPTYPNPGAEMDYQKAVRLGQLAQEKGFDWVLGDTIRPASQWSQFINLRDTDFDQLSIRTNPGQNWFDTHQRGYLAVRVTNLDFIEQSFKTNLEAENSAAFPTS